MKWSIDIETVNKFNLCAEEYLLLLFLSSKKMSIEDCLSSLEKKDLIWRDSKNNNNIEVYEKTIRLVDDILLDSDKAVKDKQTNYEVLADILRDIFPKGTKQGTHYSWRGSTIEIARKLKNLVVKYNCKFSNEEAIKATKAYIASFNGDYRYMKLLKYFLLKTPTNNNGDIEIESEFMSWLENIRSGINEVEIEDYLA